MDTNVMSGPKSRMVKVSRAEVKAIYRPFAKNQEEEKAERMRL
jgi:hypothetical protein